MKIIRNYMYIGLIFSSQLHAMQKTTGITQVAKLAVISRRIGASGYVFKRDRFDFVSYSLGHASKSDRYNEGYEKGCNQTHKEWQAKELALCCDMLDAHKTLKPKQFTEFLKQCVEKRTIPIKQKLHEQLEEVHRRLNSWWTWESTKERLKIDESNILKKLKKLDELTQLGPNEIKALKEYVVNESNN